MPGGGGRRDWSQEQERGALRTQQAGNGTSGQREHRAGREPASGEAGTVAQPSACSHQVSVGEERRWQL